jgi:hypothetical protein
MQATIEQQESELAKLPDILDQLCAAIASRDDTARAVIMRCVLILSLISFRV